MNNLKQQLSSEWNKPKASNLRKDKEGNVIDTRQPRDYKKIKEIQSSINESKGK